MLRKRCCCCAVGVGSGGGSCAAAVVDVDVARLEGLLVLWLLGVQVGLVQLLLLVGVVELLVSASWHLLCGSCAGVVVRGAGGGGTCTHEIVLL